MKDITVSGIVSHMNLADGRVWLFKIGTNNPANTQALKNEVVHYLKDQGYAVTTKKAYHDKGVRNE